MIWKIVEGMGATRDDFSCANVLKCQPPDNNFDIAGSDGVKACRPALLHDIQLAKPSIIVAVGDKALKALVKLKSKTTISLIQGQLVESEFGPVLPIFHPSYYNRTKERRIYDAIWAGFEKVTGYREERNTKVTPCEWFTGKVPDELVLDIETFVSGDEAGKIRIIGFLDPRLSSMDHTPLVLNTVADPLDFDRPRVTFDKVKRLVCHHARNDFRALRQAGLIAEDWKGELVDTILIEQLLDENRETYELKSFAEELGYPIYWENVHAQFNHRPPVDPDLEALRDYNAADVGLTRDLYTHRRERLDRDQALARYHDRFLVRALRLCAELELNGVWIDPSLRDAAPKIRRKIQYRYRDLKKKLEALGIDPPEDGNWEGDIFRQKLFYEHLGHTPIKLTPKEQRPALDRETISVLAEKDPTGVLQRYVELSSIGKQEEFLNQLLYDAGGYTHPRYNLGGRGDKTRGVESSGSSPRTGRLSVTKPGMQQQPKFIRRYFSSRFKKGCILAWDAKQIEIRGAYCYSRDPAFLAPDVHQQTTDVMNSLRVRRFVRDEGKTGNFAVIYGAEVPKLMMEFGLDQEQAMLLRSGLRETYAIHFDWYDQIRKQVKRDGFVRALTGRVRRLPLGKFGSPQERHHAINQAVNFPIQSFASDLNILCALHLGPRDHERWVMWNLVHDEGDIDCRSARVAKELAKKITNYWKNHLGDDVRHAFGFDLPCQFEVEVSIGPNWLELERVA